MITKGMQWVIIWQLRGIKYATGANFFHWDTQQKLFHEQQAYMKWNSRSLLIMGIQYPMVMAISLILKSYSEEGIGTGLNFASYILGWVETLTVLSIWFLGYRLAINVPETVYLINQLFGYSNHVEGSHLK